MNLVAPDPTARRLLTASGVSLLGLALTVLFGRLTGYTLLVTILPGGAPMAFSTIVGFLLVACALLAEARDRHTVAAIAAIALVLLGGGMGVIYAIAEPLGIRRLLYDPSNPIAPHGLQGRMSLNAAASFALLGVTVLLLQARRVRVGWTGAIMAILLAVALLAVISYLTGLRSAETWWRYSGMAVHSALGFLVATLGLLGWLVRRISRTEPIVKRTLPFFIIAATAVVVLCTAVVVSNEQRQEAGRLENRTLQLEAGIDRFVSSMARLESATRAFLVTGDEPSLERIDVHRDSIAAAVEALVELTADNPAQHHRVLTLRPLVAQKFTVNHEQVLARRQHGVAAAALVLRAEPPELMESLRSVTDGLQEDGRQMVMRWQAESSVNEDRLQWVLGAGALVTIGLILGAFSLVHKAQRDLQRANDQLEQRVRSRTVELEASAGRLRESERRLRFLSDTMPQLVWTARPDGIIESLNLGWLHYLGARTEPEALLAYGSSVHPDDLAATAREWEGMLREERSAGGEARLRRADGVYRWHLWRAHPERGANGGIVRWVGTWTDIHDQKVAEEQLERRVADRTAELATSEARFRQTFEFAGIGMAIVGIDGRWARVNKSLCDIVGYAEAELLKKTFQDITHPDDLAADLALLQELIEGRRRFYQMEKRYFHADSHVVWVRLTVSAVRDAMDRPVHFVSQVEDITEHKRLEANLAGARDQALEASRLKSEFLATMSHEIRTPMNGVIGMTSLLRDTPLTAAQEEYVHTIEASGESLLAIINDILDYSKIEAGRIDLEVSPFDLWRCVQEALDLFTRSAAAKNIELQHAIEPGVPRHVVGDATRLRQVLVNLLGNAIKFTDQGSVHVRVTAEGLAGGPTRVRFAVRDTGIGISPAGMNRLFKSFSQVDASTTRRFGGTGLGLAISRRLAELMGGTMWAESREGEGSTFYFTAQVEVQTAGGGGTGISAAPRFDATFGQRHPLRILVAEDNPVNQRVAQLLLQRIGYRATTVANGLEAVAAAQATDFDAILMDVEMPALDGCEATRGIRALRRSPQRPWIIALTAGAMPSDRERALAAGMNDFVTKPVRADALSAALLKAHAALQRGAVEAGG